MKPALADILKKSSKLMAQRGYHGTTVRDLAEATDLSLAGLYHYFQSKEDLLHLINHNGFTTLLATAKLLTRSKWPPDRVLYALICNHVCFFTSHMDEMRVMMLGTRELEFQRSRIIKSLKTRYTTIFMRSIDALLQQQRKVSKVELTRKTYLLFGMMNWIFGWYHREKHGSALDLINDIYTIFTSGATYHGSDLTTHTPEVTQHIYEEVKHVHIPSHHRAM